MMDFPLVGFVLGILTVLAPLFFIHSLLRDVPDAPEWVHRYWGHTKKSHRVS